MKDVELKFFSFLLLTTRSYSLSLWILRSWVKSVPASQQDLVTHWKGLIQWRDRRWRDSLWREDLQEMPQLPWQSQNLSLWSEFCKKASSNERDVQILATLYPDDLNLVASIFNFSLERVYWVLASALKILGSLAGNRVYLESTQLDQTGEASASQDEEFTPSISDPLFEIRWVTKYWSQLLLPEKTLEIFSATPTQKQPVREEIKSSFCADATLREGFICWKQLAERWESNLPLIGLVLSFDDGWHKANPSKDIGRVLILPWLKAVVPSSKAYVFSSALLVFAVFAVLLWWITIPHSGKPSAVESWNPLSFLPRGSAYWDSWWQGISAVPLQKQLIHSVDGNLGNLFRRPAPLREKLDEASTRALPETLGLLPTQDQILTPDGFSPIYNHSKLSLFKNPGFKDGSRVELNKGNLASNSVVQAHREPNARLDHNVKASSESFVWRANLKVSGNTFDPQIFLTRLNQFEAIKAGQVELGWKKSENIYYYHFLTKEKWDQEIASFLKEQGSLTFERAPHPRVLEPEQSRWIVEVHVVLKSGMTKKKSDP